MKKTLSMLDQLIAIEEAKDNLAKVQARKSKASKSIGTSQIVFHLKTLRELIVEEYSKRPLD